MTRPPAFMFYAADFKTNTAELTHQERGVYIDLLCHAWINDGLPTNTDRLYRLIGGEDAPDLWAAISGFWENVNGRFVNPRMEFEREKQRKRREAGSKGGQAKPQAKPKANDEAKPEANGQANDEAEPKLSVSVSPSGSTTGDIDNQSISEPSTSGGSPF